MFFFLQADYQKQILPCEKRISKSERPRRFLNTQMALLLKHRNQGGLFTHDPQVVTATLCNLTTTKNTNSGLPRQHLGGAELLSKKKQLLPANPGYG